MGQVILWGLALLLLANSLLITIRNKWNAGTTLMWVVSGGLLLCALFYKQLGALWASPFGRCLGILVLAGVLFYAGLLLFLAVQGRKNEAKGDEAAIIILGAGLQKERITDLLLRRLKAGFSLWQQNPSAVLVVSGGQGPGETIPEAQAMKCWLLNQGVPETQIVEENKSVSTETNLAYSRELLATRGISAGAPVVVVTNTFHCYRARCYAKKEGFTQVRSFPASMNMPTFLANYLREGLAMVYMWVFRNR